VWHNSPSPEGLAALLNSVEPLAAELPVTGPIGARLTRTTRRNFHHAGFSGNCFQTGFFSRSVFKGEIEIHIKECLMWIPHPGYSTMEPPYRILRFGIHIQENPLRIPRTRYFLQQPTSRILQCEFQIKENSMWIPHLG
jgi:hypothetical protein